jgi:uncharacterized protein
VIRRLVIDWPDARPFAERDGRPIRFLAASDMKEPSLAFEPNRADLGPLDGILGCGDLEPEWLSFLADAFNAPLLYVRGNHDRGGEWEAETLRVPTALRVGRVARVAGIPVVGLPWPGVDEPGNQRRPGLAWRQVLAIGRQALRGALLRKREPWIVISHVPPEGVGDAPDRYHRGFGAYRWLLRRLKPPVWVHGHTTTAAVTSLIQVAGPTSVANATGAMLIELQPPRA